MRTRLAIALTLMAVAGIGTGTASGAVVSGSNLANAPNSYICSEQTKGCTLSIQDLPASSTAGGGARAGIDGVVVSWSLRSSGGLSAYPIRLHLIRENVSVGVGAQEAMPVAAGIRSFPARLPVKAGDQIGVDFEPPPFIDIPVAKFDSTGAALDLWKPVLGASEERNPFENGKANYELLANATIEPDADRDGWGDETQDKCPGRADPSNACPVAPIPTELPPNTKIGEVRIEGAKATFRFSATVKGSKFKCKLDKKPWKSCKSPKVYRGLKEGRHGFKVKAIGPTAVPDPSPAKRSFKVKL